MEEKTLQQLKDEATVLGLDFKGMKSKAEVSKLIEDHFESQAADDLVKVEDEITTEETVKPKKIDPMRALIASQKKAAMETRIVNISSNDKRENHVTTTAYLSCENQYFGLSKIVPLGVPIELEQCLIDQAKSVDVMLHVDEIVDGKRTGNKTHKLVKKYVISYEEV